MTFSGRLSVKSNRVSGATQLMTSLDQKFSNSQHIFPENSKTASTYCSPNEANKEQLTFFVEQPATIIKSQRGWQCRHCGCDSGRVGAGIGPHAGRLDCAGCGDFIQWVGKAAMAKIGGGVA